MSVPSSHPTHRTLSVRLRIVLARCWLVILPTYEAEREYYLAHHVFPE